MQVSILCGGKSSRMQSEKGLVLYQNKSFIEHIIAAVLPISQTIQLITNTSDYDFLNYPKIKDIESDKGPIGGIYSALANSKTELSMILSCDIPLVSTEILLELIHKHNNKFDISVFADENRIHPLIGIYSKKIIPILKIAIDNNDLKMVNLLSKTKHQLIATDRQKSELFRNINSHAELQELNAH